MKLKLPHYLVIPFLEIQSKKSSSLQKCPHVHAFYCTTHYSQDMKLIQSMGSCSGSFSQPVKELKGRGEIWSSTGSNREISCTANRISSWRKAFVGDEETQTWSRHTDAADTRSKRPSVKHEGVRVRNQKLQSLPQGWDWSFWRVFPPLTQGWTVWRQLVLLMSQNCCVSSWAGLESVEPVNQPEARWY